MQGFVLEPRFVTVTYPSGDGWLEGWAGFSARIRCNPSGSEKHYAAKLWGEVRQSNSRDDQDAFLQYISSRIVEWNLETREADGSTKTYPPPAERWESFYDLDEGVMVWLVLCVLNAHMPDSLGKLQGTVRPSSNGAGTTDSTPPTPIRPKSSSKPSSSALRV